MVAAAAVINGVDVIVDVIIILLLLGALLCGNPPQNNTQTIERKSERLRSISAVFKEQSR